MMRFSKIILLICCGMTGFAAFAAEYALKIAGDNEGTARFEAGKVVRLQFQPTLDGKASAEGMLVITQTNDHAVTYETVRRLYPADGPCEIAFSGMKPGFQFFHAEWKIDGKTVAKAETGIAFSPEKLKPGTPEPEDFDAVWAKEKAAAAAMRKAAGKDYVRMREAPDLSTATLKIFRIDFANVDGKRLWGFLCIPKNAEPPFAAVVTVPGAWKSNPAPANHVMEGVVTLFFNVHDYDPDNGECPPNYQLIGKDSFDTNFFRRAWLGMDQAIEWLAEQPFFDGENLGVCGWSQGGGSTLALSALNPRIRIAVANQPALCDLGAIDQGRKGGWPYYAETFHGNPAMRSAVRYVDAANFAARIHCPITVLAGYIDGTCTPGSIYAAFNRIPAKEKVMIDEPGVNHTWNDAYSKARQQMVDTLIRRNAELKAKKDR